MKTKVFTAEQKASYLKSPGHCPSCHSADIEGGSIDVEGSSAYQGVMCLSCDFRWDDVYTLTDIEPAG